MPKNDLMKKMQEKQFVKVCGAFDVMSAKLAEMNGFDAIWASGFGISSAGTHTVSINLDGSNLNLNFYGHTSGGDFSIDDVQVKEYAIQPQDV